MENIIEKIRLELQANFDEKTLASTQRFFKEKIISYGAKNSAISKIAKEYFALIEKKSKSEIFELCDILWNSGYLEESFIASNWSYRLRSQFELEDFQIFEKWISNNINNWASCDTFCNHTIGEFIEMYPEKVNWLKSLTKSENRWVKRASAVSLIIPAKKGMFLNEIFEIADALLADKDDLVQKGYGWMLKVASIPHQKEIFDYVVKNKSIMPRTALRYAIEKMPDDLKSIAMKR